MTPQNEPALIEEVLPSNLPNAIRERLTDSMAEMAEKAMLDDTAPMAVWDSHRSFARVSAIACPTLVLQSTRYTRTEPIRRQSTNKNPGSFWFDAWHKNPNAQSRCFADTGHYLAQERPQTVANAVRDFFAAIQVASRP